MTTEESDAKDEPRGSGRVIPCIARSFRTQ
jgi:hypothetical protein